MANVKITNKDRHSPRVVHVPGLETLHLSPANQDGSSAIVEADPDKLGPEVAGLKRLKLISVEIS